MKAFKKITAGILVSVILLTSSFSLHPNKAEAQIPVTDVALIGYLASYHAISSTWWLAQVMADAAIASKEVGALPSVVPYVPPVTGGLTSWDGIAMNMIKPLIRNFTHEIVRWIDSGFAGQPTFVTDPADFFLEVSNAVFEEFITGTELEALCDPFEAGIEFALGYHYNSRFEQRINCRLTDVINNITNFAGNVGSGISADFNQGGWSGFVALTRQNQYTSYLEAEAELSARITGRQNIEILQLNWGSGFLSWQECEDPAGAKLSECKVKGPIQTPGTTIEAGLSHVLGSDLRQWELADEFDAVIAAMVNQLITSALKGFLGGKDGDSGPGNRGITTSCIPSSAGLGTTFFSPSLFASNNIDVQSITKMIQDILTACIGNLTNFDSLGIGNTTLPGLEDLPVPVLPDPTDIFGNPIPPENP